MERTKEQIDEWHNSHHVDGIHSIRRKSNSSSSPSPSPSTIMKLIPINNVNRIKLNNSKRKDQKLKEMAFQDKLKSKSKQTD
jgi:hypothetical protein